MNEVTARKWRPRLFKDFVGQEYIVHTLKQSIKESKIAHGYLFAGPRGIGKTSTARVLSMALNCLNLQPDTEPCLECRNCTEIRAGHSSDVIEIDGASNRGIDDMREMRSNIQFMPSYSKYKIYIIDEVHMLTNEAFNSILKVLEEPPSYLVFMFATTEIHKVKNTIRSRCQQFYLKRLTEEQISQQLEKILLSYHISYEIQALTLISRSADGSMRDSQSILDQAIIFSEGSITEEKVKEILGVTSYKELIDFFKIIVSEDGKAMKEFSQSLYIRGDDLSFFVLQVIQILRNLLLIQYQAQDLIDLQSDIKEELLALSSAFNKYQLQTLIDLFMGVFKDMKETDHEYFLLEGVFLKSLQYKQFVNLKDIIDRLATLESQVHIEESLPQEKIGISNEYLAREKTVTFNTQTNIKQILEPSEIFHMWKQGITQPRDIKILMDIKTYMYENDILKIEFLTKDGLERFTEQEQLIESIKSFYAANSYNLKTVSPFVKTVNLQTPPKPKESQEKIQDLKPMDEKIETDKLESMFMAEFNATEVKGE